MNCQIVIACVTHAVGDLTRTTPSSWKGWFLAQSENDRFFMSMVAAIVFFVAVVVVTCFLIACLQVGYKAYRQFMMPKTVYKRRYGKFVDDDTYISYTNMNNVVM